MRTTSILSLAVVAGLAVAGCTAETGEQVDSQEMGMEEVQEMQMVEDFRAEARARLDEIDAKIQQLQAEADSATGEAQTELHATVQDFQTRSELLEQHIRELSWETAELWQVSKDQLNRALDSLRQDVDNVLMPAETETTQEGSN